MEIKVTRINKFDGKGGFRGYATVELVEDESVITINGLSIKDIEKDGKQKTIVLPPQQKSPKDDKYYDIASVKGPLWWKISDAVISEFFGQGAPKREASGDTSPKDSIALLKTEGAYNTASKNGYNNPFRPKKG